jgi:hypothetical protein
MGAIVSREPHRTPATRSGRLGSEGRRPRLCRHGLLKGLNARCELVDRRDRKEAQIRLDVAARAGPSHERRRA